MTWYQNSNETERFLFNELMASSRCKINNNEKKNNQLKSFRCIMDANIALEENVNNGRFYFQF